MDRNTAPHVCITDKEISTSYNGLDRGARVKAKAEGCAACEERIRVAEALRKGVDPRTNETSAAH